MDTLAPTPKETPQNDITYTVKSWLASFISGFDNYIKLQLGKALSFLILHCPLKSRITITYFCSEIMGLFKGENAN